MLVVLTTSPKRFPDIVLKKLNAEIFIETQLVNRFKIKPLHLTSLQSATWRSYATVLKKFVEKQKQVTAKTW